LGRTGQFALDFTRRFWETPAPQRGHVLSEFGLQEMFRSVSILPAKCRIGRGCWTAAIVACLGLSGCASLNLEGEAYPVGETSSFVRQFREANGQGQSFAFSNKARQIEANLGGP